MFNHVIETINICIDTKGEVKHPMPTYLFRERAYLNYLNQSKPLGPGGSMYVGYSLIHVLKQL